MYAGEVLIRIPQKRRHPGFPRVCGGGSIEGTQAKNFFVSPVYAGEVPPGNAAALSPRSFSHVCEGGSIVRFAPEKGRVFSPLYAGKVVAEEN